MSYTSLVRTRRAHHQGEGGVGFKYRQFVLGLLCSTALVCAFAVWANYRINLHILGSAWWAVDDRYYDAHFNGYDWAAVRSTYSKRIPLFDFSHEKTVDLVEEMLGLLEASHLQYFTAEQAARGIPKKEDLVGLQWPDAFVGAGMLISEPGLSRMSVVRSIDPRSPLYARGVRVGWHVVLCNAVNPVASQKTLDIAVSTTSVAGVSHYFVIPVALAAARSTNFERRDGVVRVNNVDWMTFANVLGSLSGTGELPGLIDYRPLKLTTTSGEARNGLNVIEVVNHSSAERAGVEPGDHFVGMGPVSGQPFGTYDYRLRQPSGQVVQVRTDPSEHTMGQRLMAKLYERVAYEHRGSLVLEFNDFNTKNARWVARQVAAHPGEPIVLDLRLNRGGAATALGDIAGNFLPAGTLLGTERGRASSSELRVPTAMTVTDVPVTVLVSEASSSAAEVLSAALQHYRRARVIGQRTAGQVLIAQVFSLDQGAKIHIPIASFKDPSGVSLEGRGVIPDVTIASSLADIRNNRDAALECAASIDRGGDCSAAPPRAL
nr:S41 family peptidase [Xanthomonas euvesicatoria]